MPGFTAIASDPESMMFATDIQKALAAGGKNLRMQSATIFSSGPIVGLIIYGPEANVMRVATAFTQAGIDVIGNERAGDIEILVGSKPPPK